MSVRDVGIAVGEGGRGTYAPKVLFPALTNYSPPSPRHFGPILQFFRLSNIPEISQKNKYTHFVL